MPQGEMHSASPHQWFALIQVTGRNALSLTSPMISSYPGQQLCFAASRQELGAHNELSCHLGDVAKTPQ